MLFTIVAQGQQAENAQVAVLDLKTGQRKTLIRGGSHAEYVETGHLVYAAAGTLRAVRFDLARLEVTSDPVPVAEQVMTLVNGAANFAISRSGALVYVPGGAGGIGGAQRTLVWVNRQGREEPIKAPPRAFALPRLSPDGTRVALDIRDQESDIWVWDLARETLTRVTFDPGVDQFPVWTPDSRRIFFSSQRDGVGNLYSQAADNTGTVERLTTGMNLQRPTSVSPDGTRVVLIETTPKTANDIALLALGGPSATSATTSGAGTPTTAVSGQGRTDLLIHTTFREFNAEISPDGRWVAYESNEDGQNQVHVRPFPKVDTGHWQISTSGGTRPLWARSGRELFYLDGNGVLTAVPVQTGGAMFSAGNPAKLFDTRYYSGTAGRTYDVSPDGQRFLMIRTARPPSRPRPRRPRAWSSSSTGSRS